MGFSFFWKKKGEGKTMVLLDIGSGSAAAALTRFSLSGQPRLFGEVRKTLPVHSRLLGDVLARDIAEAARAALREVSMVAARVRNASEVPAHIRALAGIERAVVFLGAPWVRLNLHTVRYVRREPFRINPAALQRIANDVVKRERRGDNEVFVDRIISDVQVDGRAAPAVPTTTAAALQFLLLSAAAPRALVAALRAALEETFGTMPVSFHPFCAAAAHTTDRLFPSNIPRLVCTVTEEMTELLLTNNERLFGHATAPFGHRTFVRTLTTHAGQSLSEAYSTVRLAYHDQQKIQTSEPLVTVRKHFAQKIAESASELLGSTGATHVLVLAPEPFGEIGAQALEDDALAALFPEGGVVQAVGIHHLTPHIAAHRSTPDLFLMFEGLFTNARYGV